MDKLPKINQILLGSLIFAAGLFFMLLILLLTLREGTNPDLKVWAFVAFFVIIFLEGTYFWIKKSSEIDVANLKYEKKNAWTGIAKSFQYFDLFRSIIGGLVVLLLLGVVIFFWIMNIINNQLTLSQPFYVYGGILVGYLILRIPIIYVLKIVVKPLKRFFGKALQTYTLTRDGFTVDLNIKNLGDLSKKYIVKFKFSEIDEMKAFNFIEAQTFLKYKIGPNVDLTMRQAKELYQYQKGKIKRPSVYVYGPSSIGTNVFFQGKNLFYCLTFDTKDVNDLLNAFKKYKKNL